MKRKRTFTGVIVPKRKRFRRAANLAIVATRNTGPYAPIATRGFRGMYGGFGQPRRSRHELKTIDNNEFTSNYDTTGLVTLINGVIQGTDFNQRVGRQFNMKSILVRIRTVSGATTTVPLVCRWMLVYDSQTNGVLPAITDILNSISTTSTGNLSNRDRFQIIWDKTFVPPTQVSDTAGVTQFAWFQRKFRKCNYQVINGGVAATVASVQTGGLYFVTLGDLAAGAASPQAVVTTRVRFTDN